MSLLVPVIITVLGTLVVFYFLRLYLVGGVCKSKAQLKGKTVLVTGANRGIGKETAIELARRGARVILADVQGGEETAVDVRERSGNENVVFRRLDLGSLALVRQFATKLLEEEPRIDILVNNAGVMVPAFSHKRTKDGFELSFGVNHLGHYLLTNLLLDQLKESPAARIVIISSHFHRFGSIHFEDLNLEGSYYLPGVQAYSQSKLANLLFTRALAKRLQGSGVTVNAVDPGNTRSLLAAGAFPFFSLWTLFRVIQILFFKNPWQGAQTSIYCAVSEEMEGVTGQYLSDCRILRITHAQVTDDNAERLWQISAAMVGTD